MAGNIPQLFDIVQSAFGRNDDKRLREVFKDLSDRVSASRKSSVEELLSAIYSTEYAIGRNFGAETFIPKGIRGKKKEKCTAIKYIRIYIRPPGKC